MVLRAERIYPDCGTDHIRERFDNLGPTARLCFLSGETERTQWEALQKTAIQKKLQALESIALDAIPVDDSVTTDDSHKLYLARRANFHNPCSLPIYDFLSLKVSRLLEVGLAEKGEATMAKIFQNLKAYPTSHLSGFLFESIGHKRFNRDIKLELHRMRLGGRHFHYAHLTDDSSKRLLDAKKQEARGPQTVDLDVTPSRTQIYEEGINFENGIYYRPARINEPGLDSFIIHEGRLYVFEFTIAKTHDINGKFLEALEKHPGVPDRSKWMLVFVVPKPLKSFSCPHPVQSLSFVTKNLYTAFLAL
jgi:hypothetical protein